MEDGTGTGTPPENAQPSNNADGEVERLRKEAEQAKMRANQLANELEERKKRDADAEEAKLKENEQFKTLYEQEAAKRKELEEQSSTERKVAQVKAASDELSKDYSTDVLDLATTAGLVLADTSDEAKAAYKERLDALAAKVVPAGSPVRGSNPAPQTAPVKGGRAEALMGMRVASGGAGGVNREMLGKSFHEVMKDNPALEQMRQMAGYKRPE